MRKGSCSSSSRSLGRVPLFYGALPTGRHSYILWAQVPYENYRKVFRTSQKNIEKEMGAVQNTANDLAKKDPSAGSDADAAVKAIDGMIARVEGLKRKVRCRVVF